MKTFCIGILGAFILGQAASASIITYDAALSGPNEAPPNASPGVGFAIVTIDTVAQTMEVNVTFSGLLGTTSASHIHCCTPTAGTGTAIVATQVPTFAGFPLGVTSGSYDQTFDITLDAFYNPAFEAASGGTAAFAEATLLAGIAADDAYLNIHTSAVPGGEIRGFLVQATPEPATFLMAGAALAGLAMVRRRRA
jgi:uncharacterized protein (TIGR03382 family)